MVWSIAWSIAPAIAAGSPRADSKLLESKRSASMLGAGHRLLHARRWLWMVEDGCGWLWIVVDGYGMLLYVAEISLLFGVVASWLLSLLSVVCYCFWTQSWCVTVCLNRLFFLHSFSWINLRNESVSCNDALKRLVIRPESKSNHFSFVNVSTRVWTFKHNIKIYKDTCPF